MSYINMINAFWNFVKLNNLPSRAGYLYFAILDCANTAGWKRAFNIPNSTLESMTDLSKTDLHKYRNVLVQNGLITYANGSKSKAGIYSIVPLFTTNPATNKEIGSLLRTNVATNVHTNPITNVTTNVHTNPRNILREDKTREDEITPPPLSPSCSDAENSVGGGGEAKCEPDDFSKIIRLWDKVSGKIMSRMTQEELEELLAEYGFSRMEQAIQICNDNNAPKIGYLKAVLKGNRKAATDDAEEKRKKDLEEWLALDALEEVRG